MELNSRFSIKHNVKLRVLDKATGKVIQEQKGHNSATNSLIEGIGHYLIGEGVLNQGPFMLSSYIPKYISLGTMGLINQEQDSDGLPTGISGHNHTGNEEIDMTNYIAERPGFGTDGYSKSYNNDRPYYGLGPAYSSFNPKQSYYENDIVYYQGKAYQATEDMIVDPTSGTYNYWNTDKWTLLPNSKQPIYWELISPSFPRQDISYREVVPEYESENPKTIDVIFSAMISSGALSQFRASNKNYIFISEAGLWSDKTYYPDNTGSNGLLAGYRIIPPSPENWYMNHEDVPDIQAITYLSDNGITDPTDSQIAAAKIDIAEYNRQLLKSQILRVESNQVVQVIWKIEIGNIDDGGDFMTYIPNLLERINELYRYMQSSMLYIENVSVPVSKWVSSGLSEYPFRADVTVPGIDNTYFASIQYSYDDTMLFDFGNISYTNTDTVTLFCTTKPNKTIIIPLITCYKLTKIES